MESIFIKHISEIIYRLSIFGKMNISNLCKATGINADAVRDIILSFYELPYGSIRLEPEGLHLDEDIFDLPENELDNRIFWKADISRMDKIPVLNLVPEEKIILNRILHSRDGIENLQKLCNINNNTAIFIKGTSHETDEIFSCKHYSTIKRALTKKRKMALILEGNIDGAYANEIIPLGVVFHSEKQDWYLVSMFENNEVKAVNINSISKSRVLEKPGYIKNFDLKEYLMHCFDLDSPETYEVEVVFENYGNIHQKVSRKLSGRGRITKNDDGKITFEGSLSGIDDFKRWVWGFGGAARVIKPEWLAEEQVNEWRNIVSNYNNINEIMAGLEEDA